MIGIPNHVYSAIYAVFFYPRDGPRTDICSSTDGYDKPIKKFERILETYLGVSP